MYLTIKDPSRARRTAERGIYLLQRLRLQLDQRESDVVLNIDLGALGIAEDVSVTGSVASNVANSA